MKANLREKILELQKDNPWYQEVKNELENEQMTTPKYEGYSLDQNGLLRYNRRIYVHENDDMQNLILSEAHRAVYRAHPRVKKMYADLRPLSF